jgi:hypothetical protein
VDDRHDSRSGAPGSRKPRHLRTVGSTRGAGSTPSASDSFTILWQVLADILGTAAAATLLRRAAKRAQERWPELAGLSITREGLEYGYAVPPEWNDPALEPRRALCELTRELWTLLVDLTGPVVVGRLAQIPELRDRGIIPEERRPS